MNIFVLDRDPTQAARWHCNKHVVKMIVESAQMLSTAWPADVALYRRTHYNHPCSVWTRASLANYYWLCELALTLCEEYTLRYGKTHKTEAIITSLATCRPDLPNVGLTPFAVAIADKRWHMSDPVDSYRLFYVREKSRFAVWKPRACQPPWWPFKHREAVGYDLR